MTDQQVMCQPHVPLSDRAFIEWEEAEQLGGLFKVLGNATRLRILHALVRDPDLTVTALSEAVGLKPQAVSNQLRRFADRGILVPRRQGAEVRYRIADPCVVMLLDLAVCLTSDASQRQTSAGRARGLPHAAEEGR